MWDLFSFNQVSSLLQHLTTRCVDDFWKETLLLGVQIYFFDDVSVIGRMPFSPIISKGKKITISKNRQSRWTKSSTGKREQVNNHKDFTLKLFLSRLKRNEL